MTTIVTRAGKGSPLTHTEVDTNFTNLNTNKLETAAIPLGTAAAPSVSFVSDANTGIFSPGADQVAVSTGGVQRINIEADGDINIDGGGVFYDATNNRLAIGTTSPFGTLHLKHATDANIFFRNSTAAGLATGTLVDCFNDAASTATPLFARASQFVFGADSGGTFAERARIDTSGRLLVGTSTSLGQIPGQSAQKLQLAGSTDGGISIHTFRADAFACNLEFRKSRSNTIGTHTIVQNGDTLGKFYYCGSDGTDFEIAAAIEAFVDGTPGADDMPGRLVFSTTSDSASSPTERMRITSTGQVRLAGAGITFNGDTAAANELDDYEEGTWTPNVGGTATYNNQSGFYTKIGNIVHVKCNFTINVIGTGSTSLLSGLPFPSANIGTVQSIWASYYSGLANAITWLSGYVENNASTLKFTGNSTAATTIQNNGLILFANSTHIIFSASYRAA